MFVYSWGHCAHCRVLFHAVCVTMHGDKSCFAGSAAVVMLLQQNENSSTQQNTLFQNLHTRLPTHSSPPSLDLHQSHHPFAWLPSSLCVSPSHVCIPLSCTTHPPPICASPPCLCHHNRCTPLVSSQWMYTPYVITVGLSRPVNSCSLESSRAVLMMGASATAASSVILSASLVYCSMYILDGVGRRMWEGACRGGWACT